MSLENTEINPIKDPETQGLSPDAPRHVRDAALMASDTADDGIGQNGDFDEEGFEVPDEEYPTHPRLSAEELEMEFTRARERSIFFRALRNILFSLAVVAAVAVLLVTLVLPILQISGDSMTETLHDQDIVVAMRGSKVQTGDVIAFYYNNKILVKRVIATSGQWVDIDEKGNVYVDGVMLDEPYVSDKAYGDCNIQLPYQVPESRIFVMGDHRSVSVDSRSTTVGCVSNEQIVGRLVFCAWPLDEFGLVG